ncbi:PLP-dependent transferase [Labrys monachus]|uniref:Cystathionine beta-lyase/cystathionine gamma-synthase n=1 Tax=Labrys monachus TaxID=217067 RepID=A0ABU0FGC3_9HYPH|nr:PLP-dependent transferase [Labrys monachus]MDQ0393179.1 cystathionine beta-lyase/cystathionine gamma-synthase [Labrys monachus]
MNEAFDDYAHASLVVAHDGDHAFDAVVPPIVQSSLFTFRTFEEMAATYRGEKSRPVYSRTTNPTTRAFEQKIAELECTEDAIGFASGMGAISSTVLAFVEPGDRIVCVEHVYPDAYRLFETLLKRWNVDTVYVDGKDHDAVARALPGARLFYMESPTSWMMEAHDVRALAALARGHGVITVIDNSCASPVFQQPIRLGVDLVVHSASKYISGHSDVVAGVAAGRRELIDVVRKTITPYLGAKLAPFEAWLLLRGLRTLPTRMKAHEASCLTIARRLKELAVVTAVYHPGLGNQLPPGMSGTSGLFSFAFDESIDIPAFCNALRLFKLGVSWGGHESLVVPALVSRAQNAGPNSAIDFGVSERIVRLHVGLEGADVLWADIAQAIGKAGG